MFFLPWVPVAQGGQNGFWLARSGDWGVVAYIALIILSLGTLLSRRNPLLKLAASAHAANSVYFIVLMIRLFPEPTKVVWADIAPMITALFLLVGNVVVLLLWHELDKGFKLQGD